MSSALAFGLFMMISANRIRIAKIAERPSTTNTPILAKEKEQK
jgi:hypothetical protein